MSDLYVTGVPVDDLPELPSIHVFIVGRKGSGKSVMARHLWDSTGQDRLMIDIAGDQLDPAEASTPEDPVIDISREVPAAWPESARRDGRRMTLYFRPRFMLDQDERQREIDRAVGLAFNHPGTFLWVDEAARVFPVNQTGPHAQYALEMGRHQDLSMVLTCPRVHNINPLAYAQADVLMIFDLPQEADQRRLADQIGVPRKDLSQAIARLRDHGYLRAIQQTREVADFPPLPLPQDHRRTVAERHFSGED